MQMLGEPAIALGGLLAILHRIIDSLRRNGIVKEEARLLPIKLTRSQVDSGPYDKPDSVDIDTEQEYRFTELGIDFLQACRTPR
jgi:hypothetical protein